MSKCPKCDKELSDVKVGSMSAKTKNGKTCKSISFTCPDCSTILGIQIDPQAMDNDLLNKIRNLMVTLPK